MTQRTFKIGGEKRVNRLGYGAMRLTGQPSNFGPYPKWNEGIKLLQHASELGVDFFDSAWAYGPETADQIVGEALQGQEAVIATKGGVDKPSPKNIVVDGSRDAILSQIDKALINLRVDQIDLFQLHRVDPKVQIEESVAAIAEAQSDGRVAHIGLSNVNLDDVERALSVAKIVSVQNRFNMSETGDNEIVDFTRERGIAFIPYGPLGAHPMKQGATLEPQEALAWLLRRSPNIIVIPGTTSIAHLEENWRTWSIVDKMDRASAQGRASL